MSDYAFPYSGWEASVFCSPLSVADQAFENFTFYPNPVENNLVLSAANEIQSVNIFNLLGQKVMTVSPKATTPTIDLGNLQTGTYLMKVSIDGSKKTYRLLKK